MILLLCCLGATAQHKHKIEAVLNTDEHIIDVQHEIEYVNQSSDTLSVIYLNDWAHAYADTDSPLSLYMAEEFRRSLHLAKQKDRGYTAISKLTDNQADNLVYERLKKQQDIIKVHLNAPIQPGESLSLHLTYEVKLPDDRFTKYGVTIDDEYHLRYWYITPTTYLNGDWKTYSNKDLDDMFVLPSSFALKIKVPNTYQVISDLDHVSIDKTKEGTSYIFTGNQRLDIALFITQRFQFNSFNNKSLSVITDLKDAKVTEEQRALIINKVTDYIETNLGPYPFKKLLISELSYKKNPVYGLNQLPKFLSPFPNDFLFELQVVKASISNYLENTLPVDPRKEKWVTDGLQSYLMMHYLNTYYPKTKLLGNVSKIWGIRGYTLAKMDFNDAYPLLYMLMARKNVDQALTTSKDSLIKFNHQIANKYKAGLGLMYLDSYLEDETIASSIKEFYNNYKLKLVNAENFESLLKKNSAKNIDWYFDQYVSTRNKIDFKIKKVERKEDSLIITVKNKTKTDVPISLFTIKNDSVVNKYWLENIESTKKLTIADTDADKLVLNYDNVIPELNPRDNTKSLGGFFSNNRPISFRFFKDAEDSQKNQVFYVPVVSYNIYDGISPGMRLYNKPLLKKPFVYDFTPSYSSIEKTLIGGAKLELTDYNNSANLYRTQYRIRGSRAHYAPGGLTYTSITPSVTFSFRTDDLRSNFQEAIFLRHVNIFRTRDNSNLAAEADPDYSVFNTRYISSNPGSVNFKYWFSDLQIASKFAKLSINAEYRKLYSSNRQLNLRFFAGKFIYNKTDDDFFSYALDRPTDYLFDYDYFGRSEETGLVSQQLVIAEGGFKSQLSTPFANDWIATGNASINVWRWIEVYGDIGLVKNRHFPTKFVYDSGIRLNLVPDYFELYLPVQSTNGWEISQPQYAQKIRFIVTLSPRTLLGLFTREWF